MPYLLHCDRFSISVVTAAFYHVCFFKVLSNDLLVANEDTSFFEAVIVSGPSAHLEKVCLDTCSTSLSDLWNSHLFKVIMSLLLLSSFL